MKSVSHFKMRLKNIYKNKGCNVPPLFLRHFLAEIRRNPTCLRCSCVATTMWQPFLMAIACVPVLRPPIVRTLGEMTQFFPRDLQVCLENSRETMGNPKENPLRISENHNVSICFRISSCFIIFAGFDGDLGVYMDTSHAQTHP